MAEAFPVSGNIEPASFPYLLVDLHRHGATGSLKVTGPMHPKALYFRGGRSSSARPTTRATSWARSSSRAAASRGSSSKR